jgi:hypothetical protein
MKNTQKHFESIVTSVFKQYKGLVNELELFFK